MAKVMSSGAGKRSGEEDGEVIPAALFPRFLPHRRYFAEEIWLEPSVAAVQSRYSAKMRRKRDGCGSKSATKKMDRRLCCVHLGSCPSKGSETLKFPEIQLLGKMGKISTHTKVV